MVKGAKVVTNGKINLGMAASHENPNIPLISLIAYDTGNQTRVYNYDVTTALMFADDLYNFAKQIQRGVKEGRTIEEIAKSFKPN